MNRHTHLAQMMRSMVGPVFEPKLIYRATVPDGTYTLNIKPIEGSIDCMIDWGDGTVIHATNINTVAHVQHTYDSSYADQDVLITIDGMLEQPSKFVGLREIVNFGSTQATRLSFNANSTFTVSASSTADMTSLTNLASAFEGARAAIVDPTNWGQSNTVGSCRRAFKESGFTTGAISNIVSAATTTIESMFEGCYAANPDVSGCDTQNVTNMRRVFFGTPFDRDVSGFDFGNVTTLDGFITQPDFSTNNYDLLLLSLQSQGSNGGSNDGLKSAVPLGVFNTKYSSGAPATARQYLIDTFGWAINDDGQA